MPTKNYRLAAAIAHYVHLRDIRLSSVSADLLASTDELGTTASLSIGSQHDFAFDEETKVLNVFIDFLVRALNSESELCFGLKCSFELAYTFDVKGAPEGEALEEHFIAFAEINGIYHAWPFLRELVHSTAARMGATVRVPVYRVSEQDGETRELQGAGEEGQPEEPIESSS